MQQSKQVVTNIVSFIKNGRNLPGVSSPKGGFRGGWGWGGDWRPFQSNPLLTQNFIFIGTFG